MPSPRGDFADLLRSLVAQLWNEGNILLGIDSAKAPPPPFHAQSHSDSPGGSEAAAASRVYTPPRAGVGAGARRRAG